MEAFQTDHRLIFAAAAGGNAVATDAAAGMDELPAGSVDLIVTSPPYPMIAMWDAVFGAQSATAAQALEAGDGPTAYAAMHRLLDAVWRACARVLRPGGFLCINIGDATRSLRGEFRLYTNHARITQACEALGLQSLPPILWRKQTNAPNKFMGSGMLPAGAYVTLEHEYILILRRGHKRIFGAADRDRRRRSAVFWEERNRWFSDLWDFKGSRQDLGASATRSRSGAFPFELAFRLIAMYSMEQDTVLDPFAGTGTTMVAAMAAGRHSIGVEIDRALAPVIAATVDAFASRADHHQSERLRAHQRFVDARAAAATPLRHWNATYGFPVMTGQETDLQLPAVAALRRGEPGTYHVAHRLLTVAGGATRSAQPPTTPAAEPELPW